MYKRKRVRELEYLTDSLECENVKLKGKLFEEEKKRRYLRGRLDKALLDIADRGDLVHELEMKTIEAEELKVKVKVQENIINGMKEQLREMRRIKAEVAQWKSAFVSLNHNHGVLMCTYGQSEKENIAYAAALGEARSRIDDLNKVIDMLKQDVQEPQEE